MASATDVHNEIANVQSANLRREALALLEKWRGHAGRVTPVQVNEREHGCHGWLAVVIFGQAWKEGSGLWAAQCVRVVLCPTRESARHADISDDSLDVLVSQ